MKTILIFSFIILSFNGYANSTKLRPGLWEIKMKIFHDGKEFDPMAEMKKQMEKMPEAQKKMILEQMSKSGAQTDLTKICYTKEMIASPEKLTQDEDSECEHKVKSKTANKIVSEFKCKDGHRGTSTWEMVSPTQTKVQTDAVDKAGKKTQMKYDTKFLREKC